MTNREIIIRQMMFDLDQLLTVISCIEEKLDNPYFALLILVSESHKISNFLHSVQNEYPMVKEFIGYYYPILADMMARTSGSLREPKIPYVSKLPDPIILTKS